MVSQIAKFMGPTWGPPGTCRPQMGPMLAPRTLLWRVEYSCRTGLFLDSWCLGSVPCQIINGHCIANVGKTGQCLPCKRISNNSAISRKDSKGTCIFMFPRNNSALNGLRDSEVSLGFSLEGRFAGVADLRQNRPVICIVLHPAVASAFYMLFKVQCSL